MLGIFSPGWECLHPNFHQAGGVCTRLRVSAPCCSPRWLCFHPVIHQAEGVCTRLGVSAPCCSPGWKCLHPRFHQAGDVCTLLFTRLGVFSPGWGCLHPSFHSHTALAHSRMCCQPLRAQSHQCWDRTAARTAAQGSFPSKQEALPWRHCLLQPAFLLGAATPGILCAGCPARRAGGDSEPNPVDAA